MTKKKAARSGTKKLKVRKQTIKDLESKAGDRDVKGGRRCAARTRSACY